MQLNITGHHVDITDALRLKPHYQNNIEITYALTQKVKRSRHETRRGTAWQSY